MHAARERLFHRPRATAPHDKMADRSSARDGLPSTRALRLVSGALLVVAALVVLASAAGLTWGTGDLYAGSSSVLVSRGADIANLLLVPLLLGTMWAASRGSLLGLLLQPGVLFYTLYAYLPYAISAPVTWLLFVDVALVTVSVFALIGLLAAIDGSAVRARLARAPARPLGGALAAIGLLAYVGLAANAVPTLAGAGGRGHWVSDWVVGTPVLVLGGVLLWRRAPLGYVSAAGLLLVSVLGGVAFAVAASVDNGLAAGPQTEPSTIAVHLVISAISAALLVVLLVGGRARPAHAAPEPTPVPSAGVRPDDGCVPLAAGAAEG